MLGRRSRHSLRGARVRVPRGQGLCLPRPHGPSTALLRALAGLLLCPQAYDQKNIRRRVYDALNVLMAMNIISKEKKEIKWIGLPTNSAQECQNLEVGCRWVPTAVPVTQEAQPVACTCE